MELTKEQLEAVRNGEPIRVNEEGTELVVVRADPRCPRMNLAQRYSVYSRLLRSQIYAVPFSA